jgi:segregation and condensation protein B
MDKEQLKSVIEVLVFASDQPLTVDQIQSLLEDVQTSDIEDALNNIEEDYRERAFILKRVGGGYQFATRPEYSKWISRLYVTKMQSRLSRAALETLAIIAFKQPVSKVEVSAIRGVNSDWVIRGLLERRLINISGRDKGPGRALLFTTTKDFLHHFGLVDDLSDLPRPKEITDLLTDSEGIELTEEIRPEELNSTAKGKVSEPSDSHDAP